VTTVMRLTLMYTTEMSRYNATQPSYIPT
jgi:hypothetical protein